MAKTRTLKRVSEIDALRGIAALGVMIFHYLYFFPVAYSLGYKYPIAFWGQFGVHFFFITSGFLIFMVVSKKPNPLVFAFRRFFRLYPVFWFCCLFTTLIVLLIGGERLPIWQVVFNMTMLAGAFKVDYIDGVYWTLIPELIFYFSIFLLLFFKQQKNLYYWGMGFLALSVIGKFILPKEIIFAFNLKWLPFFWIGINLYLLETKKSLLSFLNILLSLAVIVVIFWDPYIILATCVSILVLLGVKYGQLKFLATKPLIFLGSISFPLYLLHSTIGFYFILMFSKFGLEIRVSTLLTAVIIMIFAFFVHLAVENRFIELGKKIDSISL